MKWLHIKFGFLDTEWLKYQEFADVNVEITQNLYNAYCTQKYFYVEKDLESWDPKIHSPRNYLRSFYLAALIEECGTEKQYPLAMFWNGISKKTISYYKGTMENGTPSSSSDSEMASKEKKNRRSKFKKNALLFSLKIRMMHCLRIGQKILCTKAIKYYAQFWSRQIISPATWVWNGLHWFSCWLHFFK